jgi:uncharacterized membrane protein YebE (DUF533 family)
MAKLLKWLQKKIVDLIDPDQEQRVQYLESVFWSALVANHKSGQSLNLGNLYPEGYSNRDVRLAAERTYEKALGNAWKDGKVTLGEKELLAWSARVLEIKPQRVQELNVRACLDVLQRVVASAMMDGEIDEGEAEQLREVAAAIDASPGQLLHQYFASQGANFLQSVFLRCVEDGKLDQSEWSKLVRSASNLGLAKNDLLNAIMPQAKIFVEHVLADARSDGQLSKQEDETLAWLLSNLQLPNDFRSYVENEIAQLRILTDISRGKLPVLRVPANLQLRAGEILHQYGNAIWTRVRHLKSGPIEDRFEGVLAVTDARLIFVSTEKSTNTSLRSIVMLHQVHGGGIYVTSKSKTVGTFFIQRDLEIAFAILYTATGKANQTIIEDQQAAPSRHIPRVVRQRVYQRYGGRCVDCGATDYLEFDHIIPVAKGGSNSEKNIQLLCRRCNWQKSDLI